MYNKAMNKLRKWDYKSWFNVYVILTQNYFFFKFILSARFLKPKLLINKASLLIWLFHFRLSKLVSFTFVIVVFFCWCCIYQFLAWSNEHGNKHFVFHCFVFFFLYYNWKPRLRNIYKIMTCSIREIYIMFMISFNL